MPLDSELALQHARWSQTEAMVSSAGLGASGASRALLATTYHQRPRRNRNDIPETSKEAGSPGHETALCFMKVRIQSINGPALRDVSAPGSSMVLSFSGSWQRSNGGWKLEWQWQGQKHPSVGSRISRMLLHFPNSSLKAAIGAS